jgi:hypothetical protein
MAAYKLLNGLQQHGLQFGGVLHNQIFAVFRE